MSRRQDVGPIRQSTNTTSSRVADNQQIYTSKCQLMSGIVALGMQRNDAGGYVQAVVIYARYFLMLSARLWPSCRHDAQGHRPKMSDTDRVQLLPAY